MKIKKIDIKNYRSLHNVSIYPMDILALVGKNNSGKSNIINALKLFFDGSIKLINDECFYKKDFKEPIEIIITFEKLSNWERQQFEPWMDEDILVAGKNIICNSIDNYTINDLIIKKVPEPEWLQVDIISGDKINEWWPIKEKLKIEDLDFGIELGTSKPAVNKWKEIASNFSKRHRDKIPWKEEKIKSTSYEKISKIALPEFIHIPAVRDILDEAKVAKTNPFGQLISSVLEKISEEQKNKISIQLKEIEKKLNRIGGEERLSEIKDIEIRLTKFMSELMECDIEIETTMPQLREIFDETKIYANDGERTTIETKGHGLQRYMIFTILRSYAELMHSRRAEEKAEERTTIFAIEEPELYLHPQSQRTLMSVLREIAKGKDQIIYSTHSSLFVDISYFDQICIMRREKKDGSYESNSYQLSMNDMLVDLKIRKNVDGTEEGIRELYSNVFNPMINEGFFADKVVIVEGPSEQYSLPIYSDALGYNLDRNNVSVVHSDGKGEMDRVLRVFNGFEIPTYLWFDGDKFNNDTEIKKKTIELLELLEDPISKIEDLETKVTDRYTVLENKLETTLRSEIKDYENLMEEASKLLGPTGTPLKHRYIARELKKRVGNGEPYEEVLPKTIIEIVENVKNLSYFGSILKK